MQRILQKTAMKSKFLFILLLFICAGCKGADVPQPQPIVSYSLCNANATAETQRLWSLLCSQYGKNAVSGVVANIDWNTREAENVYQWTGKYPALNVFDFINIHASKDVNPSGWLDYSDMTPVTEWYNAGGIVGCMWHWQVLANNGINRTCSPGTAPGETSFDASKINDPASAEYKQMVKDIDQVAGYLKKMQKLGIPVIWRPLHEAAGNMYEFAGGKPWFWWGAQGAEIYKQLWRFMYDRMVNYHKLNNLIWVWTSQVGDADWYPGADVVDVVGRDNYYALQYPLKKEYDILKMTYPDKLITLAECGNGDDVDMSLWSDIWAEGSRWSWFMTWYDSHYNDGTSDEHQFAGEEWWRDAFNSGVVLDRDEVKGLLR